MDAYEFPLPSFVRAKRGCQTLTPVEPKNGKNVKRTHQSPQSTMNDLDKPTIRRPEVAHLNILGHALHERDHHTSPGSTHFHQSNGRRKVQNLTQDLDSSVSDASDWQNDLSEVGKVASGPQARNILLIGKNVPKPHPQYEPEKFANLVTKKLIEVAKNQKDEIFLQETNGCVLFPLSRDESGSISKNVSPGACCSNFWSFPPNSTVQQDMARRNHLPFSQASASTSDLSSEKFGHFFQKNPSNVSKPGPSFVQREEMKPLGNQMSKRAQRSLFAEKESNDRFDGTTIVYSFDGDERSCRNHLTRIRIPKRKVTLRDLKEHLPKSGSYKYFFKVYDQFMDTCLMEEFTKDQQILPNFSEDEKYVIAVLRRQK